MGVMSLNTVSRILVILSWLLVSGSGRDPERPPLGLVEVEHPKSNPPTEAKINLGKRLFFDTLLSRDGTISCATCHIPEQAFAHRGEARSRGIGGRLGHRNSPSLLNVAFAQSLFHDGRSPALEDQVWEPLLDENEMGNHSEKDLLQRLGAAEEYVRMFSEAFGVDHPDKDSVSKALAVYQRTLLSGNSLYDQWYWGNPDALSKQAKIGYGLFIGRAQCWQCHPLNSETALLFTDHSFHNTGVSAASTKQLLQGEEPLLPDLGRFEHTKETIDRFHFKTPSLRNVALTPPYMHDGSIPTLKGVVQFYNQAEENSELLSLYLDENEVDALVAFLESLTGDQVTE